MKKTKGATIAIVLIAVIIGAAVMYWYTTTPNTGLPGAVYAGRVKINLIQTKHLDGSTYAVDTSYMRMLHGSMDYNDKVGDFSGYSITGDVNPGDKGYWYLVIDYGTNNTQWLDKQATLTAQGQNGYISRIFGADGDKDGFDEEYIELYLGNLKKMQSLLEYMEMENNGKNT